MNRTKLQNIENSLRAFKGKGNKVESGCLKLADLPPETVAGAFQVLLDIGAIRRTPDSQEVNSG